MSNNKKLQEALDSVKKKYGAHAVLDVESEGSDTVSTLPTGCFSLDYALGGGLPRGRIIEMFGAESSGKSTVALYLISQIQKAGGTGVLIDAEFSLDTDYCRKVGVDTANLIVTQPTTLEEAMDTIKSLVESNAVDIIVLDSLASLVPKAEAESEEMLKDTMALQARLMSKALRIMTGPISRSKTIVIFINQLREHVGVVFGKKEYTPGGKALKFFSSVRIEVRKGEKIMKGEEQIGNWMHTTMVKNKVGNPFRKASFELYYERGIDLTGDALDYGERVGTIKKTGNTYSYGGVKLGVGRENAKNALAKDPVIFEKVRKDIAANINNVIDTEEHEENGDSESEE